MLGVGPLEDHHPDFVYQVGSCPRMASVGQPNGKRNSPGGGRKEEEKLSVFPYATRTSISLGFP
ncbi:hypothetical protein [Moorena producens]|uniref:hypothetical protein n=1 Tax=Moorena producens TaxID=1155739 RepID=UPI003C726CB7